MVKILCQSNIFYIFIDHFTQTGMLKEGPANNNNCEMK